MVLLSATAATAAPVTHAVSTTTNVGAATGNGECLNGGSATSDPVNCNIYSAKEDVWLSGLPTDLEDGTYFLAVLDPGGQQDPNDGTDGNLSDDFDNPLARSFQLSGGAIVANPGGTHTIFNNKIQLANYADTDNPGGVYILAVCAYTGSDVTPSSCKYDAFKVQTSDVPDNPGLPLTVVKDADGAYTNTYTWGIDKSVDKTTVQQVGGSATFNYTVGVTHDTGTVSGITVTGTITVFNPNDGSVAGVDVTDVLSDGTVCAVTDGTGATIAAHGDLDFAYTCELDALPQGQLDNTATATWGDQAVDPDAFLTAGTADWTFEDIVFDETAIDDCVDVTDTHAGTLGSVCADDASPTSFKYQRSIAVVPGCVIYDNTATFTTSTTQTTGSDSQSVTVCGPYKTGALTIGFWKNTNGQSLIKTYGTGLSSYLAGLGTGTGPFADAAGKTNTQLASYVSGILSGATATDMNKMLKAQMLASALDVWFSGPGYTGTTISKVKPPSNFLSHNTLGTFKMDTTAICPMVDNTTAGTATCKGLTPSTNAVASGALPSSPMAMQAILDFASTTPAPFNGSTSSSIWYAGNRTKQEILKNVFDQFNNQLAFGSF